MTNFRTIGEQNDYTKPQIEAYGAFILFAKWLIDSEAQSKDGSAK